MSQDLGYLQHLDAASFEAERNRLIAAEILKVPPERRKKLVLLQMELDKFRDTHTSEEFLMHINSVLRENLENLEDKLQFMKNTQAKT